MKCVACRAICLSILFMAGAYGAHGAGDLENIEISRATIRAAERSEGPLLEPIGSIRPVDERGVALSVPGPIAILDTERYVYSDVEEVAVYLIGHTGPAVEVVRHGQGPNEVLSVTGIVRRSNNEFTVVSTQFESKLVTVDSHGRVAGTQEFENRFTAAVPFGRSMVGMTLVDGSTPAILSVSGPAEDARLSMLPEVVAATAHPPGIEESLYTPAYGLVSIATNGSSIWAVSRWRTVLIGVRPDGALASLVIMTDETFPDGASNELYVTSGGRVASPSIGVDELGYVFVIAGVRTATDDGRRASHVNVLDRDGKLVSLIQLAGVSAEYIDASRGQLLVSPGHRGGEIVLYDYSDLESAWDRAR